jgi:hypothetical protein
MDGIEVLGTLDAVWTNLPKMTKSASEPNLYQTHLHSDDFLYPMASPPKTPLNAGTVIIGGFPLFTAGTSALDNL